MPKDKPRKCKRPATNPSEACIPDLKSEDVETGLTACEPQFQPIHIMHFDELNRLWPSDRRIPSVKSRRAWAMARNLNPANVHSWWYRRKKVAAKLKIRIPRDTYELDIGMPPELPVVVKEETAAPVDLLASESTVNDDIDESIDNSASILGTSEGAVVPEVDSHSAGLPASSLTLLSDALDVSKSSPGFLSLSKDAYMHYSFSNDDLHTDDTHIWSSDGFTLSGCDSLPPSSPPIPSPLSSRLPSPVDRKFESNHATNLILGDEETDSTLFELGEMDSKRSSARDALWASFALLEPFYPAEFFPTRDHGVAVSCCAYTPILKLESEFEEGMDFPCSADSRSPHGLVEDFGPWCMNGNRFAYDGSLLGQCSYCCATLSSSLADD